MYALGQSACWKRLSQMSDPVYSDDGSLYGSTHIPSTKWLGFTTTIRAVPCSAATRWSSRLVHGCGAVCVRGGPLVARLARVRTG
jgi:hypothetical protein